MQDDKMIVDEVLRGNKEAFAQIIQKYNRRITLLIRKMLGQPPPMSKTSLKKYLSRCTTIWATTTKATNLAHGCTGSRPIIVSMNCEAENGR